MLALFSRLGKSALWVLILSSVPQLATAAEAPKAQWIWHAADITPEKIWLRKAFTVPTNVKAARLATTCDNGFTLFVNGRQALTGSAWEQVESADVAELLKPGENLLAVAATNEGPLAGFILRLEITSADGTKTLLVSDQSWKTTTQATGNWQMLEFDAGAWADARELGAIGSSGLPWNHAVTEETLLATFGGPPRTMTAQAAKNVVAPPGFKVEKVYDVPKGQGSWVSLAKDDRGHLIASDQGGAGLYLITPAKIGDAAAKTSVERLPVKLTSAQGLLWAFDSLYVMVNGNQPGLHRAVDSDGDGRVDTAEYLKEVPGGGEHGPHALVLSPDGKSIYAASGNHTKLPSEIAGSRLPTNWSEDHLLPRRWDANGHAAGILAPGGWICKVDPSGKQWEVVSSGYRNEYDMAFNADGELFTYDADMEWDFGMPWYRPTRVNHATSGSEFGWRSGTGKWPAYYEDSLPAAVDIGPGSPVGVTFGYGTKFPAKYQKALFILDWTFSTIYAVHLSPDGASYTAKAEDFVYGQPLQVTDAVVGDDGALYFTAGGRGTQSSLYRVIYTGSESTAAVDARDTTNQALRELRQRLESFHRPGEADLELIWTHLSNPDRFIRYAARVALENRPVDSWRARALAEANPRAAITALMALSRQGKAEDREAVLSALEKIDLKQLSEFDQLALLRTYQLALIRLGKPDEAGCQKLIARFNPLFPGSSEKVNAELVQLLVYLDCPDVVAKTLAHIKTLGTEPIPNWSELAKRNAGYGGTVQAMLNNMPPVRGLHYAFVLRNATKGWTVPLRREYFAFFSEAARHPGGASFPGFVRNMRDDALAKVSENERVLLDDILSVPLGKEPYKATPPKGPGRKWSKDDALATLGQELKGRNFEQGRNLYHAVSCAKCHRMAGEGGAVGPDLSTAGRKFSLPDLMDAILEPSKAISDQYGSHQVLTSDGEALVGRVVEVGDQLTIYTVDANAEPRVISKADVEEMKPSPISQMPEGLVDSLNEDELRDLIAYLLSSGDANAAVFKP